MKKRLGKAEWISGAFIALSENGIDAVRVERLAKALQVTKGSFYWHFKNRDMLLADMLDSWKAVATNDIITVVEEGGGDARARLQSLFAIVFASDGRLDMAMRGWASKDPEALRVVASVDRRRISYLETLFGDLGFSTNEATARARLSYSAFIGQFAVGAHLKLPERHSQQYDIVFEMLVRNN